MTSMPDLTQLLRSEIPLSAAAGIEILQSGPLGVSVGAPFDPNRNYHGTVFGGSLAVVGIVTGFVLVDAGLREAGYDLEVVIQRSVMDYRAPVTSSFRSDARRPEGWPRFLEMLDRRGKGRIEVASDILCDEHVVATHTGIYAGIPRS